MTSHLVAAVVDAAAGKMAAPRTTPASEERGGMASGESPERDAAGQLVTAVMDEQSSVIELAVAGVWDWQLWLRANQEMRKCLRSHPAGLLVDVQHLGDPAAASAALWFTLHTQAERMAPPVTVAVCVRDGSPLAVALNRRGARYRLPVFTDLLAARSAVAHQWPLTDQIRVELPPRPHSAAVARQLATAVCPQWGLTAVLARARLVTSELVLNAVEHAGTEIQFTVTRLGPAHPGPSRRGNSLHLAVHDLDPRLPPLPHGEAPPLWPSIGRGQGLHVVDAAADGWGVLPTARGKLVWAVLRDRW